MVAIQDAEQYIRMTCKQYGVHIPVTFCKQLTKRKRAMGLYHFNKRFAFDAKKITLSYEILASFELFKQVLLHEIAHYLDHKERGKLVSETGRMNTHGANFNKWCRKLGIATGPFVPRRLVPTEEQKLAIRKQFS